MKAPDRRREPRRTLVQIESLDSLADKVSFVTFEKLTQPTWECLTWPGENTAEPVDLVRAALGAGSVGGPWLEGFPRYAWLQTGDSVYEFRLTGRVPGEYTGYELPPSNWPEELT